MEYEKEYQKALRMIVKYGEAAKKADYLRERWIKKLKKIENDNGENDRLASNKKPTRQH